MPECGHTQSGGSQGRCLQCRRDRYEATKPARTDARQFSRWNRKPTLVRFWAKVDTSGGPTACWPWMASTKGKSGYGQFNVGGNRIINAHSMAYEVMVGPVPEGRTLDHTCHSEAVARGECLDAADCRHRLCCNPEHLEPVTHGENVRRGIAALPHSMREPARV